MPATAIYDLEIQPVANDLVVASHGRGVWILDDLAALQRWGQSDLTLFPLRDAYRIWQWSPVNTFTDPKIPRNEFVGDNPLYGAIVTYYLPSAPKHAHDRRCSTRRAASCGTSPATTSPSAPG